MKMQDRKIVFNPLLKVLLLATILIFAAPLRAQRTTVRPPRVQGQTTVGTVNGQNISGNDLLLLLNTNSPFMPPLDGSPVTVLRQFENKYPIIPSPSPTPTTKPKPVAPSFSVQIQNMMKTGQEWLFKSLLDVIIKPAMPVLIFFAWIIGSFVLGIGFLRRFSDNKGIDPEQLTRWGIRTVIFMVIIGGLGSILGSFLGAAFIIFLPIVLNQIPAFLGIPISTATAAHLESMIFGALIIFFLIVEPHGLARLWAIAKEKLRLWPFPH